MSRISNLAELKDHLRYDVDDNDLVLEVYLEAAESVIFNYVDEEWQYTSTYPKAFKIAVLLLAGYYDQNRNAEGTQKMLPTVDVALAEGTYMPPAIRSILYPYRNLTMI